VRLLEEWVWHELRGYDVDPDDLTAESVAAKIGLPPSRCSRLGGAGDATASASQWCRATAARPEALAQLTGDRKVETVPLKEVQPLTGYVRGGVTVLGAKKAYPVYVDETIELFEVVSISAGCAGLQILLAPGEYLHATGGRPGPIAKARRTSLTRHRVHAQSHAQVFLFGLH